MHSTHNLPVRRPKLLNDHSFVNSVTATSPVISWFLQATRCVCQLRRTDTGLRPRWRRPGCLRGVSAPRAQRAPPSCRAPQPAGRQSASDRHPPRKLSRGSHGSVDRPSRRGRESIEVARKERFLPAAVPTAPGTDAGRPGVAAHVTSQSRHRAVRHPPASLGTAKERKRVGSGFGRGLRLGHCGGVRRARDPVSGALGWRGPCYVSVCGAPRLGCFSGSATEEPGRWGRSVRRKEPSTVVGV